MSLATAIANNQRRNKAKPKLQLPSEGYSPRRTTELILRGSIVATSLLAILLLVFDALSQSIWFDGKFWIIITALSYLLIANYLFRKKYKKITNWMIILFYIFIALCTLLVWGLNAPVGILTISFAITLPGILMGSRAILPVACIIIFILMLVQFFHSGKFITPDLHTLSLPSTYWDVLTYSTVLSVFALVSWVSGNQREKNLKRALQAESALRAQKDALSVELEKESASLRLTQLKQIQELHNFALLGQSTAATLHELSNHLSILNLDIEDIRQQHSNSTAISNAKISIQAINKMVSQSRKQLDSYNQIKSFNAISVANQSIKDMQHKFLQRHVILTKIPTKGSQSFTVNGSPFALMQIITILLNNALDACYESPSPKVKVMVTNSTKELVVSVQDNGVGIDEEIRATLFRPTTSKKASGLGVGLYIAQHLVNSQFNGKLELIDSGIGAHFLVKIPQTVKSSKS